MTNETVQIYRAAIFSCSSSVFAADWSTLKGQKAKGQTQKNSLHRLYYEAAVVCYFKSIEGVEAGICGTQRVDERFKWVAKISSASAHRLGDTSPQQRTSRSRKAFGFVTTRQRVVNMLKALHRNAPKVK